MGARGADFSNRSDIESAPSDNGTIALKWDHPPGAAVELQHAGDASFSDPTTRYQGADAGSVVTGLPEGSHFFRIREKDGAWSQALEVKVEFFPPQKLFLLLGVGGVVVVATIVTIVLGALNTRREAVGV